MTDNQFPVSGKMSLADIPTGRDGVVVSVHGHGGFVHRVREMGFVRGERVHVVRNAPLRDPVEYEVMGNHVSLRRAEAALIEVVRWEDYDGTDAVSRRTFIEQMQRHVSEQSHTFRVALVGNPNCGKTSFFNHATGLREQVGNYSGVTVESKTGVFHHGGYTIEMVDLPGTYSITEYTPEERYVRAYLAEHNPDVILNIVDASNLERNLYLTTQLIDRNQPMVMALNMYDELQRSGATLDVEQLSRLLGLPIVPTVALTGQGIDALLQRLIDVFEQKQGVSRHVHIYYGDALERAIADIKSHLPEPGTASADAHTAEAPRCMAISLLGGSSSTEQALAAQPEWPALRACVQNHRRHIEREFGEPTEQVMAEARYAFVRGALGETFRPGREKINHKAYRLDALLTHRWLGLPLLALFLWVMFQTTFTLGAYPQDWIDAGVGLLGEWLGQWLPAGSMLRSLVVDGVIAGVGSVIVFLPQIVILFFFISLLEDTGYMARAAFIMDRIMHRMGLHGKSFIPYLIGFGCGVPAIMATRTLANRKDRIITMLTVPFMSCSARLPVYLLFVSAFFTRHQGLILLSLYVLGIGVAILTALLLSRTCFAREEAPFVMELPPYRMPTLRNTLIHMWEKAVFYLRKMSTVILVGSIVVWALGYFPQENAATRALDNRIRQVEQHAALTPEQRDATLRQLDYERQGAQIEGSCIGLMGHWLEPVVAPLGFNWQMGVSLLSGLAAKEIIVSTLGVLYQVGPDADESSHELITALRSQQQPGADGAPVFTPLVAYAFMTFVLLYYPCIAALAALRREAGTRWMWFCVVYTLAVAWIGAFLVYHVGGWLV